MDPNTSSANLAADIRLLVGRLARRLRQEAAAGLTASQLSALASVEDLEPVQLGDLARVEAVAPPTLTRAVARLEDQALVRRRPDPSDGRAVLIETTAAGRRALRDLRRARVAFLAERLDTLGDDDRHVVARAVGLLEGLVSERVRADTEIESSSEDPGDLPEPLVRAPGAEPPSSVPGRLRRDER